MNARAAERGLYRLLTTNLRTLALIPLLILPLVAWLTIDGVRAGLEDQWSHGVRPSAVTSPTPLLANRAPQPRPSLAAVCTTNRSSSAANLAALCADYQLTAIGKPLAIASVGITLFVMLFIGLAGFVARAGRLLLLILFVPGLYLTMAGVLVLIASNVLLLLAAIYLLLGEATGTMAPFLILAIGAAGVMGIAALLRACLSFVGHGRCAVTAVAVSPEQQPALWQFVTALAARLGARAPDHIVLGLEPNFFVTESHVDCCSGPLKGRTLYLSLPMCHIMILPEFEAVLAHELAHYKGLDTRFSGLFYPVYARASYALASLDAEGESFTAELALLPARFVIQTFLESFAIAESRVSRRRELAADRVAAEAAGSRHIASALVKLHAFSSLWKRVAGTLRQSRTPPAGSNASFIFKDVVLETSRPSALQDLDGHEPPHPTDTHPPLSARLDALHCALEDLVTWALVTAPSEPAVSLVSNSASLEEQLTQLQDWWRF